MIKKLSCLTAMILAGITNNAWADSTAGITTQTADQVSSKVVTWAHSIIQPIGAVIIFISIAFAAIKIIITANKPEERAKAMSSLPYILFGGVGLGAIMLIAGFVIGSGQELAK
ncbi:hypothetical protein [Desulfotomaculum nigrificans]|uniref:hypothetical protein n=1 Tax=Desulfotomaculum nigrificans TaxID=1565 RepID=UPI0001FAEB23|nr:hypothetical protein [Desulfotomaculum nigrificans]